MTSFSTVPQSFYLTSIAQLMAWSPASQAFDAFNVAIVPLRPRPVVSRPLVEDCNDFNSGYVNPGDLFPQGVSTIDTYNFTFWEYLDHFCYFAHHRIDVPTPWWINAAHLHGVPVIGTIDFEGNGSEPDITLMLDNAATCISQLVALAQHYGFDGWFFNVEASLPGGQSQGQQLIAFVSQLRAAMHAVNPNALVIWYDAVLPQGYVSYQNCLNSANNPFFGASSAVVSDGLFANYWWYSSWPPQPTLIGTSLATAAQDQRSPFGVYTGVDVFARGTGYSPGNTSPGNDAITAIGACTTYGTSTGIFAPGWTFDTATGASPQPHHSNYEALDISFWIGSGAGHNPGSSLNSDCVAKYIPERIIPGNLPFATNFDRGCGNNFVVRGTPASANPWSNLSLEGPQPTYRYWALPGSATTLAMNYAYGNGYDGGASLTVQGTNAGANDVASFRLYDVNAPVTGPTAIGVVFQPNAAASYPKIQLQLVFANGQTYTTSAAPTAAGNWLAINETMTQNVGQTIGNAIAQGQDPASQSLTPAQYQANMDQYNQALDSGTMSADQLGALYHSLGLDSVTVSAAPISPVEEYSLPPIATPSPTVGQLVASLGGSLSSAAAQQMASEANSEFGFASDQGAPATGNAQLATNGSTTGLLNQGTNSSQVEQIYFTAPFQGADGLTYHYDEYGGLWQQDPTNGLWIQASARAGLNGYGYLPEPGDADLLARAIMSEGAGTPDDMTAIGWSIVNRIGGPGNFGDSLDAVLLQHNGFAFLPEGGGPANGTTLWQDSATGNFTGGNAVSWQTAQTVAQGILYGGTPDPTDGATFYFASQSYDGTPQTAPGGFQFMLEDNRLTPSSYQSAYSESSRSGENFFFTLNPTNVWYSNQRH